MSVIPTKWRSYCDHRFCDVSSPYVWSWYCAEGKHVAWLREFVISCESTSIKLFPRRSYECICDGTSGPLVSGVGLLQRIHPLAGSLVDFRHSGNTRGYCQRRRVAYRLVCTTLQLATCSSRQPLVCRRIQN